MRQNHRGSCQFGALYLDILVDGDISKLDISMMEQVGAKNMK